MQIGWYPHKKNQLNLFHVEGMNCRDDVNLGQVGKIHCFPNNLTYRCILTNRKELNFFSVVNLDSTIQR